MYFSKSANIYFTLQDCPKFKFHRGKTDKTNLIGWIKFYKQINITLIIKIIT